MRWALTYTITAALVVIVLFLAFRTVLNPEINCQFFSEYMVDCRGEPAA